MALQVVNARTVRARPEVRGCVVRVGPVVPGRERQFPHGVGSSTRYSVETWRVRARRGVQPTRCICSLSGYGERRTTRTHDGCGGDTTRLELCPCACDSARHG
jgi:hypothetical protein